MDYYYLLPATSPLIVLLVPVFVVTEEGIIAKSTAIGLVAQLIATSTAFGWVVQLIATSTVIGRVTQIVRISWHSWDHGATVIVTSTAFGWMPQLIDTSTFMVQVTHLSNTSSVIGQVTQLVLIATSTVIDLVAQLDSISWVRQPFHISCHYGANPGQCFGYDCYFLGLINVSYCPVILKFQMNS